MEVGAFHQENQMVEAEILVLGEVAVRLEELEEGSKMLAPRRCRRMLYCQ